MAPVFVDEDEEEESSVAVAAGESVCVEVVGEGVADEDELVSVSFPAATTPSVKLL
jgi:hypothetical protein